MSRYEITQEHLESLQNQITQLRKLHDAKEQRIKDLELHKFHVSGHEASELLITIGKLERDIQDLLQANEKLISEVESTKKYSKKIEELELLLKEERKLREYSEKFAKHIELQYADESLIRELTAELCQLQKNEIEIENKKIIGLQKKIEKLEAELWQKNKGEVKHFSKDFQNETEILKEDTHMKLIILKFQDELVNLYGKVNNNKAKSVEDQIQKLKLERWLTEIKTVMNDVSDMELLRKDLNNLKHQIEGRKKSLSFKKRNDLNLVDLK